MLRKSVTSNAKQLSARIERRSAWYVKEIQEATKENGELVRKRARTFTARRYFSLKQLREMGHPYAKRAPRPPVAAHIINRQTGEIHRRWTLTHRRTVDGILVWVTNQAKHAKYMLGTTKMIVRPVLEEAVKRTKPQRDRNIRNARRRVYYRVTGK